MYFDSFADFVAMGNHGFYVWTAYGLSALLIIGNMLFALRQQDGCAPSWRAGRAAMPATTQPLRSTLMNPVRKQRLMVVLAILVGLAIAVGLAVYALRQNINLFYTPQQVVNGEAPVGTKMRVGGLVEEGRCAAIRNP